MLRFYFLTHLKEERTSQKTERLCRLGIYQSNKLSTKLEVKVEEETVWLSQAQMIELFNSTKQNVSLHINNIFKEKELEKNAVVKYSMTTARDGKNIKLLL